MEVEPERDLAAHEVAERDVVTRAATDIEAFTELYRSYLPQIHAYAYRRTGNRAVAEDICAATFESALTGIARFRWKRGGVRAWLYRIASNHIADHYRREGRAGSERGQRAMAAMVDAPAPDDTAEAIGDDHAELRDALAGIHPRYQRAIALRYLADLDHDDAAAAMGLTKPAFAVVLSRALKAMRRELEPTPGRPDV